MKETSDSRTSRHSSNESTSDKGENEEANKVTSQMTSCLGVAPAQCCCMKCIQIVVRHLVPSVEEIIYPLTLPNFYAEACTMKPSGKQDENCEAKINSHIINNSLNSSCILSPAMSATDLRVQDKHDLKTVYYILCAIEGRVRRLKSNLDR